MDIGTGNSLIVLLILAVVSVVCPVLAGVLLLLLGKWIVFSELIKQNTANLKLAVFHI